MLDVGKPPTDSLYKFLAISGVLILTASIASPIWFSHNLNKQRFEFLREMENLNADASEWQQAGKEMERANLKSNQSHERMLTAVDKFMKSEISKEEVKQAFDEADRDRNNFYDSVKVLEQKISEWDKKNAEAEYKKNLVENDESLTDVIRIWSSIGFVIGLAASITGFLLWYKRTQRYEDLVLKKKTEESDKEGDTIEKQDS